MNYWYTKARREKVPRLCATGSWRQRWTEVLSTVCACCCPQARAWLWWPHTYGSIDVGAHQRPPLPVAQVALACAKVSIASGLEVMSSGATRERGSVRVHRFAARTHRCCCMKRRICTLVQTPRAWHPELPKGDGAAALGGVLPRSGGIVEPQNQPELWDNEKEQWTEAHRGDAARA